MGQAKKRGTLEQRTEQAREKFEASIDVRRKEIEELNAFEKRQNEALAHHLDTYIFPEMHRKYGALMRTDFSQMTLITQQPTEGE